MGNIVYLCITMVQTENLIIQRPLFQFITAFNNFSLGKVVWEQYQKFAVPAIENATKGLEQAVYVIPTFTPLEAANQHKTIQIVTSNVKPLRKVIEEENNIEFLQFKDASLAFFAVLEQIEYELNKAANQADSTRAVFQHMTRTRRNPAIVKHLRWVLKIGFSYFDSKKS